MEYQKINDYYLLALYRGDYLVASIKQFCQEEKIKNGFFIGLGAVDEVELAHYSVVGKKYSAKKFSEPLEMVSLLGNVFLEKEEGLIIHSHAIFGKKDFQSLGGHLVEAKIAGVGEIIFFPLKNEIKKEYDKETGLKIIAGLEKTKL